MIYFFKIFFKGHLPIEKVIIKGSQHFLGIGGLNAIFEKSQAYSVGVKSSYIYDFTGNSFCAR